MSRVFRTPKWGMNRNQWFSTGNLGWFSTESIQNATFFGVFQTGFDPFSHGPVGCQVSIGIIRDDSPPRFWSKKGPSSCPMVSGSSGLTLYRLTTICWIMLEPYSLTEPTLERTCYQWAMMPTCKWFSSEHDAHTCAKTLFSIHIDLKNQTSYLLNDVGDGWKAPSTRGEDHAFFIGPLMGEVDSENHPTSGHENWGIGIHPFSDTLKHYAMLYTHIHKLAYININMNTYIYNHIYIDKYDTFSDIRTVILVYSIKYPF